MRLSGLERLLPRVTRRVERVTGQSIGGVSLEYNPALSIAGAAGSTIGFNRETLAGMTRREAKGVLAHELSHVVTSGGGAGERVNESYADAVRARLGLGAGAGYNYKPETLFGKLSGSEFQTLSGNLAAGNYSAEAVRDMARGTDGNGPTNGNNNRPNNRNRDTTVNNASHGAGTPPPVSVGTAFNSAAAMAAARMGLAGQLSGLRADAGLVRGQYTTALGQIRANRISATGEAEADALERGIVGSSVDAQQRASAVTEAGAARVDARYQRNAALMGLRRDAMAARIGYTQSVQEIAQAKAAEQTQIAIAEFQANQFDAMQQDYQATYRDILRKLRAANNRKRDRAAERQAQLTYPEGAYTEQREGGPYAAPSPYTGSLGR